MTKLIRRLLPLACCLLLCLSASAFEGKIKLATKDEDGGEWTVVYTVQDARLRIDSEPPPHLDYRKCGLMLLMNLNFKFVHSAKAGPDVLETGWIENKPDQTYKWWKPILSDAAKAPGKITEGNPTREILGYRCSQYLYSDKVMEVEAWVTPELSAFRGLGASGEALIGSRAGSIGTGSVGTPWADDLGRKGLFPLRFTVTLKKTKQAQTFEAKSVEPGAVPDTSFLPPAGYAVEPVPPAPPSHSSPPASDATFGARFKQLFQSKQLDTQPVPLIRTPPVFPYNMRRAGVNGYVVVEFIITTEGNVADARVVESTHEGFNPSALHTVSTWKFKPGLKKKQPVNVLAVQRLDYSLGESKPVPN